jgi:hypothetical protein
MQVQLDLLWRQPSWYARRDETTTNESCLRGGVTSFALHRLRRHALPQAGVGANNKTVTKLICDQQQKYGFLEPMDWRSSEVGSE